jgi:nucleoside recognition membrane protein YjiH
MIGTRWIMFMVSCKLKTLHVSINFTTLMKIIQELFESLIYSPIIIVIILGYEFTMMSKFAHRY